MTDDFKEFELQGWQGAAGQYDASFSRLTQQTIPRMLDVLGVQEKTRFLDVACGPGYLTAEASRRGAAALGVDFSESMIELARQRPAPGAIGSLQFCLGDAEDLGRFADASFDAAGMNFGILHLSNPEKALREMHRVLTLKGRAAFTIWRPPEEALAFSLVLWAIEKHGDANLPIPRGPGFFQYSAAAECERILQACGFTHHVETLVLRWKLTKPEELFEAFLHGTARTGGLLRRQQPEALARIREELREEALRFANAAGELVIPMPAQLAWGEVGC